MPLTNAEKQARWRAKQKSELERLRKAEGRPAEPAKAAKPSPATDSQELIEARKEIDRLRRENKRLTTENGNELSLTSQQKVDRAIKQATGRLEIEIGKRVHEENLAFLKSQLDYYNENARHCEVVLKGRYGIMTRGDYRSILSCLHPDRITDVDLKRRYEHAFNLFTKVEKFVLNEKESPTKPSNLPKTVEELLKRKAELKAARSAKRAGVIRR